MFTKLLVKGHHREWLNCIIFFCYKLFLIQCINQNAWCKYIILTALIKGWTSLLSVQHYCTALSFTFHLTGQTVHTGHLRHAWDTHVSSMTAALLHLYLYLGHLSDAFVQSNSHSFIHSFIHWWRWSCRVPTSKLRAILGFSILPRTLDMQTRGTEPATFYWGWLYPHLSSVAAAYLHLESLAFLV